MELEPKFAALEGFRMIFDRVLMQEETQEGIVPDTLPDILRIVEASGQVFLLNKEVSSGSLRIAGSVRATVLYIPEGEDGTCCTEINIPFVCAANDPLFNGGCSLWAMPKLVGIDAQIINPRKILFRAETAVDVRVFAPEGQSVCSEISGGGESVQQYTEEHEICVISHVKEKNITFSDVIALPGAKPRAVKLLRSRVEAGNLEAKVIGEKVILKGEAELAVLYQSEQGLVTGRFFLPYSQAVDVGNVGETHEVFVSPAVTELECELQQGDPGSLAVTMGMILHTAILEKKNIRILSDVYSTSNPMDAEEGSCSLCVRFSESKYRQTVRYFCESAMAAKMVVDTSLSVGRVWSAIEDGKSSARADTMVRILFVTEEDELCSADYAVCATCEYPEEENHISTGKCVPVGELIAVPVTGGIEVRFDVEFSFLTVEDASVSFVKNMKILPIPEGGKERPSVVLRKVGCGEKLWDIAKFYQSTIDEIKKANEIETEGAAEGMMLLIPRRR